MRNKEELARESWAKFIDIETVAAKLQAKAEKQQSRTDAARYSETGSYLREWGRQRLRTAIYDIYGPGRPLWLFYVNDVPIGGRVYDNHMEIIASIGGDFDYSRVSHKTIDPDDARAQGTISTPYGEKLEERAQQLLKED